jgi:hypothetical protein
MRAISEALGSRAASVPESRPAEPGSDCGITRETMAGAEPGRTGRRFDVVGLRQVLARDCDRSDCRAVVSCPINLPHAGVHAREDACGPRLARSTCRDRREIADGQDRPLTARGETLCETRRDADAGEPAGPAPECDPTEVAWPETRVAK